jgi:hypothetical protein
MKKGYLMGMYGSFLCMIILFSIACNSNSSSAPSADTVAAVIDTPVKAAAAPMVRMSGFLNILYIDAKTFIDLKNEARGKLTFRFYLKQPDSLTLGGWSNDGNSPNYPNEPPKPDITLWVGGNSAYEIGSGNYFGNLVLYNRKIRNIITKIGTPIDGKYVLFAPLNPADHNGQVTYEIHVVSVDPHSLKWSDVSGFAPTGDQTNPSPPRGANN